MTTKVLVFALITLATLAGCDRPAGEPGLESRIQRVEEGLTPVGQDWPLSEERASLAERMAFYGVPGVSIAVIDDYELQWARGYGRLNARGEEQVTPETLFHAGSIAKPLSAAAALVLVEQGLLALDEDVNGWLLSWQIPENAYTAGEKVSLRRLLSHSAGLKDGFTDRSSSDAVPGYLAPGGQAPAVTLQQLLNGDPAVDVDGPTRVVAVPGTQYRYANADYAILELLMVDAAGKAFPQIMGELILEPLAMNDSTYAQPLPAELRLRAAAEHDVDGRPLPGERLHFPMLAAGGLWSTPSDLARFAIELMRSFDGQSNDLLSQESAETMLSEQIETPDALLQDSAGLGVDLAYDDGLLRFSLPAGTWGSTALLWAYPETGQGAIIMTNSAASQGAIRLEILSSIGREYGWPIVPSAGS